jgi:HAD superfamily hydrolase (TIGR01509 family)
VSQIRAALFDYSGTLFRLEEDDSWFKGITVDDRQVEGHVQAELMRRMTSPTGVFEDMTTGSDVAAEAAQKAHQAWANRDLAPHLHREAYLHVLRESGVGDKHAESLYGLMVDPLNWTPYPDTADVLRSLHRKGIGTAVVSNIAFDVRPAFASIGAADYVDEFVLSFEVGAVKPNAEIFDIALTRLGVAGEDAVMIGDSDEADGGARALGCGFALVDPLPTGERLDGLRNAMAAFGIQI